MVIGHFNKIITSVSKNKCWTSLHGKFRLFPFFALSFKTNSWNTINSLAFSLTYNTFFDWPSRSSVINYTYWQDFVKIMSIHIIRHKINFSTIRNMNSKAELGFFTIKCLAQLIHPPKIILFEKAKWITKKLQFLIWLIIKVKNHNFPRIFMLHWFILLKF